MKSSVNYHRHVFLRPEDSVSLSLNDKISMVEMNTNLDDKSGIYLSVNGYKVGPNDPTGLNKLCTSQHNQFNIQKGPHMLGRVFINVEEN